MQDRRLISIIQRFNNGKHTFWHCTVDHFEATQLTVLLDVHLNVVQVGLVISFTAILYTDIVSCVMPIYTYIILARFLIVYSIQPHIVKRHKKTIRII